MAWIRAINEVTGIIEACTRVVNMVQTKPIALQIFGEDHGVFPKIFESYRTRGSSENSKIRLNLLYNYLPENRERSAAIPDIDLVIRTGGGRRLSGFLPEQRRYAELYFLDKLWPDFTTDDFEEAVLWYKKQEESVFG